MTRPSAHALRFELNGTPREVSVPDHTRLIDLLRDQLGLTGTKEGCSVGVCGACSVLVDGQLLSACLLPAAFVDSSRVTTIEGLAPDEQHLSPLQDAFIRHGGFQCGICTPGQIVAATALLQEQPHPTREQIRSWMMGNLCRCTGYYKIVESITAARAGWRALMRPFQLHQAEHLDEVLVEQGQHGADETHLIAGGTSLMVLMNLGLFEPGHLVSLRRVAELQGIRTTPDGGLEIGPMATHRQLELSPEVRAYAPALAATFGHVATVRIRNQGTLGGNLAHADPAQDPPPMLIALDASVALRGPKGERTLALDEFFVDYLTTRLQPDEVLTAIRLPALAPGTRATYQKFLPRTQDDYATVSVAATLRLDADGRCQDVRVALGGAAGVPLHARPVEDALRGEVLSDQRIAEAAALVLDLVDPPDDARGSAAYKRRMARVWTDRALRQLRDQSNGAHA